MCSDVPGVLVLSGELLLQHHLFICWSDMQTDVYQDQQGWQPLCGEGAVFKTPGNDGGKRNWSNNIITL